MRLSELPPRLREAARAALARQGVVATPTARGRTRAPRVTSPFAHAGAGGNDARTAPIASLVFVLPLPASPNRSNRSRNPITVNRDRKRYFAELDELQRAGLVPPPPATPIVRARLVVAEVVVGAVHDEDNLAYRAKKWPADWLVSRGYVATDRPHRKRDGAGLTWAPLPEQTVSPRTPARVTLTLIPISA